MRIEQDEFHIDFVNLEDETMKCRKATFVLAVASTLCATSATASIKEECKQMKVWGEKHISEWYEYEKRDALLDKETNLAIACHKATSKQNLTEDERISKCQAEAKTAAAAKPFDEIPSFRKLVEKMRDFSIVYSAFCKR